MLVQEILDIYSRVDRPGRVAHLIRDLFTAEGLAAVVQEIRGEKGSTDFVKALIPGSKGKSTGGAQPTLGIIGRLGGIGARPGRIGFVSDGDGALSVLSVGLRLARMRNLGDRLEGDVIISTHLCTDAPTVPHDPVPFMDSPVDLDTMNQQEVDDVMDAILTVDTSRGNKIINTNGFAISPTVKEGWILRVADDLLGIMEHVTGKLPAVVPITMQDITPYSNGVYHFNSLMTTASATAAPVVGIAITSEASVPGCATGVTSLPVVDSVGRYIIEVAKAYTAGECGFYDKNEFDKLILLYGDMKRLQR